MNKSEFLQRCQQIAFLFHQQQFTQVIALFDTFPSALPLPPELFLMVATAQRRLGQLAASQRNFSRGLALYPQHAPLHNSLGNLLLAMAQPQQALAHLSQVIQLDPSNTDGYYNSARAYQQLAEPRKMLQFAETAHQMNPSDINIAIFLAEGWVAQQDVTRASALYQQMLAAYPQDVKLLNNFANLQRKQGHMPEAITLLERAVVSNSAVVWGNLAACYALVAEFAKAFTCYQRALAAAPEQTQLYLEYAHLLWQQGATEPFAHIEARLASQPHDVQLRIEYIRILLKIDQLARASAWLPDLLQQAPERTDVQLLAAHVYRDQANYSEALRYAEQAVSHAQPAERWSAQRELGYTLLALQQGEAAKAVFLQQVATAPHDQGGWTFLSSAYRLCQDDAQYARLCNYALVHVTSLGASADHSDTPHVFPADFNRQLALMLPQLHVNQRAPIGLSLAHGSQTFENIFDRNEPLLQQLRDMILGKARAYIKTLTADPTHPFLSRLSETLKFQGSWSVLLRDQGFHKSHFHSMGWLSGVYYVDVPAAVAEQGQGWLMFGKVDIPNYPEGYDYALKPQAGMLVLFPSYMWHGTIPFHSASNRLTVAFDLVPD